MRGRQCFLLPPPSGLSKSQLMGLFNAYPPSLGTALQIVFADITSHRVYALFNNNERTSYIRPSDVVYALHKPPSELKTRAIMVLHRQAAPKACNYCGRHPCKSRCSACKKVYYCARTCQLRDWARHKAVCSADAAVQVCPRGCGEGVGAILNWGGAVGGGDGGGGVFASCAQGDGMDLR